MNAPLRTTTPSRADLADAYTAVRARSLALIAPLTAEDCQLQSMPDASPSKWHLAHTTWFFETFLLERFESGFRPLDPAFRVLFNSYYQGVGPQHPRAQRGLLSRPTLAQVKTWRHQVDARMQALIATHGDDDECRTLLQLGLNHEQQHQELLLTDIKHALSCNPSLPAYQARPTVRPVPPQRAAPLRWLRVPGGIVPLGHDASRDGDFHFDNEGPRHEVLLRDVELASRPVTHGDFQAFIADGGYRRPELWLSMGWDWVRAGRICAPLYWQDDSNSVFTLHGSMPVDADAPLPHLSYFEADAYARWADARLPTEAEWEHAARHFGLRPGDGHSAAQGHLQPRPATESGEAMPLQMFGDVWEWTQSPYAAYPGYRPAVGAVGEYNGKFMCNQFVLRGGSCITPAGHVRASYRNFFPPDAQWQFSGLRLARDV
jgi:ergothioneine biosynthesis protein EgtB